MISRSRSSLLSLALACALLVSGLLVAPVQAKPSLPDPASNWAALSTPDRINAAYASGQIDAGTRLLYLTYAVYDHNSLPAKYKGTVGWYGTRVVKELHEAYNNTIRMRSLSRAVRSEMDRLLGPSATAAATYCDKEDLSLTDTSIFFTINYTDSGADALGGTLTLQQYKDSLDAAYTTLVTNYGWAQPPLCGVSGVDCGGPTITKYPVQVADLGTSLYGYVTVNDGIYAGTIVGDNPHTALTELNSVTSCMVLNSDFQQLTGNPLNNLNATTSHEFVHAIQNAWGDPGNQMEAMWAESTAAYFEDEMDDTSNTQYEYLLGSYNDNNLSEWASGSSHEYTNFLFFRYFAEQYGGANSSTGGEKVIQKFFENQATSTPAVDQDLLAFKAAVESFALGGGAGTSNFKDVFHAYAIALKFLKNCGGDYTAAQCWEEGSLYRAKTTAGNAEDGPVSGGKEPAVAGTIATTSGSYAGTIKTDYGINFVRLPAAAAGNYKIELSSSDTTQLRASVVCDTGTAFVVNAFSQLVVGSTARGFGTYNPTGCQDVVLVITNQMETVGVPRSTNGVQASETHNFAVQLGTANSPSGPTAVTIASFVSANDQLVWQTGDETDLAGFHIWRGSASAAETRLTDTLIGATGGLAGHEYTWQATAPLGWGERAYYWLEAVNADNSSSFTGPVEVQGQGRLFLPSIGR